MFLQIHTEGTFHGEGCDQPSPTQTEPGLILRADTGGRPISGLSHHKDLAQVGHPPTALYLISESFS